MCIYIYMYMYIHCKKIHRIHLKTMIITGITKTILFGAWPVWGHKIPFVCSHWGVDTLWPRLKNHPCFKWVQTCHFNGLDLALLLYPKLCPLTFNPLSLAYLESNPYYKLCDWTNPLVLVWLVEILNKPHFISDFDKINGLTPISWNGGTPKPSSLPFQYWNHWQSPVQKSHGELLWISIDHV